MPGFAEHTIDRLVSISGIERHDQHYEQLLQVLAEIFVARHLVAHQWPDSPAFAHEPTPPSGGAKRPELTIAFADVLLAVEVKAPSLLDHERARGEHKAQLVARSGFLEEVAHAVGSHDKVLLPRDNPVKDFLISADEKFAPFCDAAVGEFYGVHVIVWDDYAQEPLNALVHPQAGLFTENSFARNESDQPLTFGSVNGVVLIRHLHQFVEACADRPLRDAWPGAFDYGNREMFPPKAYVPNPSTAEVPGWCLDGFEAEPWDALQGAEYVGADDAIFWIGLN
jgi:hypothetical protein